VVVTRPGDDQVVFLGELGQPCAGIGLVLPVVQLESEQAGFDELGQPRLRHDVAHPTGCRVREHRHAPGRPNQPDRLHRRRRIVRLVIAGSPVQDPGERLAAGERVATRDQGVGDMRTPNGGIRRCLCEHVVPGERVIGADPLHHLLGADEPGLTDPRCLGDNRGVRWVEQVGQQVHAGVLHAGAEFHSGNEGDSAAAGDSRRLGPARGRVVVRECDGSEAGDGRCADESARSFGAVRHA
jgi:hypothetical protein